MRGGVREKWGLEGFGVTSVLFELHEPADTDLYLEDIGKLVLIWHACRCKNKVLSCDMNGLVGSKSSENKRCVAGLHNG